MHILTPDDIPTENKDKVLIHVHRRMLRAVSWESGTPEGIVVARDGHYKVISVEGLACRPKPIFPLSMMLSRSTKQC